MNTIKGISFYEHKETPGLGARIEEDKWRATWSGIHSYDENGAVATGVTKAGNSKDNWIDGISGATLTSRGVSNMIQFWLGEQGYKPYLDLQRKESGQTLDSTDVQAKQISYRKLGQDLNKTQAQHFAQKEAHSVTELASVVANGKEA